MTRSNLLMFFGCISILFSCRSTNKTVDKVKIKTQEATTSNIKTETIADRANNVQTVESGLNLILEALSDTVSVERKGNKIVITGAKKIELNENEKYTTDRSKSKTAEKRNEKTTFSGSSENRIEKRTVKRKGVPGSVWIFGSVFMVAIPILYLILKKGHIFGLNINLKNPTNDKD